MAVTSDWVIPVVTYNCHVIFYFRKLPWVRLLRWKSDLKLRDNLRDILHDKAP